MRTNQCMAVLCSAITQTVREYVQRMVVMMTPIQVVNICPTISAGGMLGGGGMRMAPSPSVTLMPRTSFGFGGFGGFGGYPGYYGGGYGTPVSSGGGGGGLFTLLALGVLGYAALQILPRLAGGNDDSGSFQFRQIPMPESPTIANLHWPSVRLDDLT